MALCFTGALLQRCSPVGWVRPGRKSLVGYWSHRKGSITWVWAWAIGSWTQKRAMFVIPSYILETHSLIIGEPAQLSGYLLIHDFKSHKPVTSNVR